MKPVFFALLLFSCTSGTKPLAPLSVKAKPAVAVCVSHDMPSRAKAIAAAKDSLATTKSTLPHSGADHSKMIFIKGGSFDMGTNEFADALPIHRVQVSDFYMDEHEVTNAQFANFVKHTGYQTVAERPLNPKDYPGVPAAQLKPGSAVFTAPQKTAGLQNYLQWWKYVPGASWKHPHGPTDNLKGKENDPVVQVCYEDAAAYAKWAGKRLPTEAEWDYAPRAKNSHTRYYWGNELKPNNKWQANVYQGRFPTVNTAEDGFVGVAPVKSFPANVKGLYDMDGNVWEWCADFYRADYYRSSPANNPKGPADSYDAEEPGTVKRVQRGGSFLCHADYCERYIAGSRGKGEVSSASNNLGFRCVK